VSVSLGGGGAWHGGRDLPYVVLGTAVTTVDHPDLRLELGVDQRLRVTSDRFQRPT
jgi:hypothetical protein